VAAHLPDMRGGWAETATLRSLLANDARAPRSTDLEFGFAGRSQADDDALARFVAGAASEPPSGPTWSYSNLGWCVLGRVIESVTDATWEDATRMHLLDPAGMRETAFATSAGAVRRATGHAVTPDGPAPIEPLVSRAYGPAGTSLVSTICCGSAASTSKTPRSRRCGRRTRMSASTPGSTHGVSAGPGSTGTAAPSGAGTA
jgi:CubicO group peptidase (beta-lactamase class C family)